MTRPKNFKMYSLIVILFLLVGCSPSSLPVQGSFTGSVEGTNAFVAMVTNGTKLMAYVCDGETIAEWFTGELGDGSLSLASKGGANLDVAFSNNGANGTFTSSDGSPHSFKAALSTAPSGLYRTVETIDGTEYVGGWIILPGGQQRGAVKGDGTIFPSTITEPDPIDFSVKISSGSLTPDYMDPEIDL